MNRSWKWTAGASAAASGFLTEGIERVRSQRALHRAHRRDQNLHTVALVGYTNAGKSTLFNALTSAGVVTSARMFATLDPTVRALPLDAHRTALLSDTVGFIRKLPPHLVAAFRATLEELEEARLLLHVTDASDPQRDAQDAAVEALLEDLGVASTPRLHVWNKVDLLAPGGAAQTRSGRPQRRGLRPDGRRLGEFAPANCRCACPPTRWWKRISTFRRVTESNWHCCIKQEPSSPPTTKRNAFWCGRGCPSRSGKN